MFYSQSFLTRKGPMGTVWCAAHLQHKLKKSHYISTNIPSTVEKIIDPVMPMALRISGHLLLGVVRIFSKQVDYFQEDCNVVLAMLNRIYITATVNLTDDANRAPFHSITLPEKFNLDSIEIDDYMKDGNEDSHIKSHKDITLMEQVPTGNDPYIAISFGEYELDDQERNSPFIEDDTERRDFTMEENVPSPPRECTRTVFEDQPQPNMDTDFEDPCQRGLVSTPQTRHSIEKIRAAVHSPFNGSPILADRAPPDGDLVKQFDKEREVSNTSSRDEPELPETQFSPSPKHQDKISSGHLKSPEFSEHSPTQLGLRPTPTPAITEPKFRKRKRNQLFDDPTVFNNEQMKMGLGDASDLFRKRRNCPSSSLDIWRRSKTLKKYDAFYGPSIAGCCPELNEIYSDDFISSKHLSTSTSDLDRQNDDMDTSQPDLNRQDEDMDNPQPDPSRKDDETRKDDNRQDEDMDNSQPDLSRKDDGTRIDDETEVLRNNKQASPVVPFSEAGPFPSGRSRTTPQKSVSQTNEQTEIPDDTTVRPSARSFDSGMESPSAFNIDNSGLSNIPELVISEEDLGFLEQDAYSSDAETAGLHHSLSSRTRAVAKYLKGKFPCTPISCNTEEPSSGDLNLNKIMEGKSRKKCARIFFETLVLKHNEIIDVEQEEPYGDLILKATPKLSKGDFKSFRDDMEDIQLA